MSRLPQASIERTFGAMRWLATLALLAAVHAHAVDSSGCSCFSPDMREQAARETLQKAQVAVFGRITEMRADGSARLVVLESFKGPAVAASVAIGSGGQRCPDKALAQDSEALVLVFEGEATACETYAKEHFLLEALRSHVSGQK